MVRRTINRREVIVPQFLNSAATTPFSSANPTPRSSAYPSAYPSEDEADTASKVKQSFPFLRLPSELRIKIYSMVFAASSQSHLPHILDLDPAIFKIFFKTQILALFRVSKQIHCEASPHFFSTYTFRIFPTFPGRYFKTKRPLIARVPAHYRQSFTSLELRVGPGWNNPPRGWVVNDELGLADCTSVRVLKIFVECDPSDAIFKGFRRSEGFYETFCATLLDEIMKGVPSIKVVEFDSYSSVKRSGDMIAGLEEVIANYEGKVVRPAPGWELEAEQLPWRSASLINDRTSKSVAVLA